MTVFCILAAGKGSRLKEITKLHKCLLPIDNKAVISHIIEKAPQNTEFVVAVGYQKELIKEYCLAAHPYCKFTFVEIPNYSGPGSGPGLSLYHCKPYLQCPFYLACSDCIVAESLPPLDYTWLGTSPTSNPSNWATAHIEDNLITKFMNKSPNGYSHAFIGLAGIYDFKTFWNQLKLNETDESEMVSAFYNPGAYNAIKAEKFTWYDTGTPSNYKNSKKCLSNESLGMEKEVDELTYHVNDRCVKVFKNWKIAEGRIYRAKILTGLRPRLVYKGKHAYAYEWIPGKTLYEVNNLDIFIQFLDWCEGNLWVEVTDGRFQNTCLQFYRDKTYIRLGAYYEKRGRDTSQIINGRYCQAIEEYLYSINWYKFSQGVPVLFHGDLQLENVIYGDDKKFYLIDWRDSFGDVFSYGDLYYDFAKLYGSLCLSYHNIKLGKFDFSATEKVVFSFENTPELAEMKYYFENWLLKNDFDLYKVRILSALIYLNMAPLHVPPFDELLFNHAKYLLSLS
jgi:dTDP-glucose pyrophosphorylase